MSRKILQSSSWCIISSLFSLSLAIGIMIPAMASAQNVTDTLSGLNQTANRVGAFRGQINNTYDSSFLASKAGQIVGLALSFIGILFLGLMIYAGITWMTAGGNEQTISKSKDLLINATIGIVIVFAAYALTAFIGNQFIGK